MNKEEKTIKIFESIFNNSNRFYVKDGIRYVDSVDIKALVVELMNKLE